MVTGNAASAIAFRNAVLKVVPKAVTKRVIEEVKRTALGQAIDVETARRNCLANYAKVGVDESMICQYLGINTIQEIDKEILFELKATWTAIKEGTTTVQESFFKPLEEKRQAAQLQQKAEESKKRMEEAAARQAELKKATQVPEGVDPETGEIKKPAGKKSSK